VTARERDVAAVPEAVVPEVAAAGAAAEAATEDTDERRLRRLDVPMSVLGVIFLLVVLAQSLARAPDLQAVLAVASWALWAIFVAEFLLRWWVAESRRRFLRRNWWQILLLAVPFLRFVRLLWAVRLLRVGRVASSALRGSRSAGRLLSGRLGWLAAVTAVVILAGSQLLYLLGAYDSYGPALHGVALSVISAEPLSRDHVAAQLAEVIFALYAAIVFAALAGSFGAFFLRDSRP
jgi:voltage-gated potassium channel